MRFAALVSSLVASAALASSGGVNSVGVNGCNACHTGGTAPTVTLGPTMTLGPAQAGVFTLSVSSTNGTHAGFLVTASQAGTFTPSAGQRLNPAGTALTHSAPREKDATGNVRFEFKWTPGASVQGPVTLSGWGNSVDLLGTSQGDRAAQSTLSLCVRASTASACAGARCGAVADACGGQLTCPTTCAAPQSCGGGGTPNVCGCTPLTRAVACASRDCGEVSNGCGGTFDCGTCGGGRATCGGGGMPNVCGCSGAIVPESCNGTDDDCNGLIDDGNNVCAAGLTCVNAACVGADAGTPDAGAPVDAGSGKDAGTVADAGTVLADAGSRKDAGAPGADGGDEGPDDGPRGCGCGAGGGGPALLFAALGLLAAMGARRRRA